MMEEENDEEYIIINDTKIHRQKLIEEIAELEHKQWMQWSKSVIDELIREPHEPLFDVGVRIEEKHQEWLEYWKDYSELSEEMKEKDREWAKKFLQVIEELEVSVIELKEGREEKEEE